MKSAWVIKCINELKIIDESKYLISVSYSDFHLNQRFYKKKTIKGELNGSRGSVSTGRITENKGSLTTGRTTENNLNDNDSINLISKKKGKYFFS